MMIFKGIKLHRKLRRRQEYLCHKVCWWSTLGSRYPSPDLPEFVAVNKAVSKLNRILPGYYFFLSDLFGFSKSLKYVPTKTKCTIPNLELITFDLVTEPGFKHKL